jgi:tight adherence protein B
VFSPTVSAIAVAFMGLLSVGGLVVALYFPQIVTRARTNKRVASVSTGKVVARTKPGRADVNQGQRRKQVQESIRQLEDRQKENKKRINLRTTIAQAGLTMSVKSFWLMSLACGAIIGLLVFATGSSAWLSAAAAFAGGIGLPRWLLSMRRRARQDKFLLEFANAIDIVVRGIKSGLPVNDCIKIIANESPDPVGPEFAEIVEGQKVGIALDVGLERMYERMPLAEVNFLAIVIAIQQRTGGNLAEALANLSKVLRDRRKMKAKIQAMSQEAKASAAIIGALPPCVMGMLYFTSPDYIELLWTTSLGQAMLVMCGTWMLIGVLVMKKMIAFDF